MKQLRLWGILLTLMILALTGCGGKGDGGKGGVPTPGAVPTPTPAATGAQSGGGGQTGGQTQTGGQAAQGGSQTGGQTQAGGQTQPRASAAQAKPVFEKVILGPLQATEEAVIGPLTYKLGAMEGRPAGMTFPGYDYFLIHVTVTNTGTTQWSLNSLNHFTMYEPDGKQQKINIQAGIVYKDKIDGNLEPGQTISGWLGFLVKLDDGIYKLVMHHPDLGDATWEFEAPLM